MSRPHDFESRIFEVDLIHIKETFNISFKFELVAPHLND